MKIARNLRLDPTPLTAFSIADDDKVLAPNRIIYDFFEQSKITQRAYAFNSVITITVEAGVLSGNNLSKLFAQHVSLSLI